MIWGLVTILIMVVTVLIIWGIHILVEEIKYESSEDYLIK